MAKGADRVKRPAGAREMRDFTKGSILQHILVFSWPMLVGNALQALYNTVDSFWVGRFIGTNALGAVSVSFPIIFGLVSLIMGLTMATTTMVSQYRGAGREDLVRNTVANSLMLIVVLGVISTVIGVIYRVQLLQLIRTPPEILGPAADYLGIFLAGLLPMFLYNVLGSILRGLGDSKTPTYYLAYAVILNIILDPIFIIGFGPIPAMGIKGVAWATVIAQVLSAVLTMRYLYRFTDLVPKRRSDWRFDASISMKLFTIGLPAAAQSAIVSFSILAVTTIVNTFGGTVVAAFGAANRLDQFAFLPALSISLAVSALVGQNLGAGKTERVREIVFWSTVLTASVTFVMTLIALIRPGILMQTFTSDPDVLREGSLYLRIVGLNYVPLALMFTLTGVLRGAGDTFASMVIAFVNLWLVRIPLAALLAYRLDWGVSGAWWAITISTVIGALLNYVYYLSGRWKRKIVVQPQPAEEPSLG